MFPGWWLLPVVLALVSAWRWRRGVWATAFWVGVFTFCAHQWYQTPMYDSFADKSVTVQGRVINDPVSNRFVLEVRAVNGQPAREKAVVTSKSPKPPRYGDLLEFRTLWQKPQPPRNPGAFDALSYDTNQGIHYSLHAESFHVLGHDDRGVQGRFFLPLRHRLVRVIQELYPPEQAALVSGILIGFDDGLAPEVESAFRDMGVVHILVVSGANVALLILPLLALLEKFGLSVRRRYALAIVIVVFYGGLTGGGASVVRACTMSTLWCLSRLLSRETDRLTSWALAGGLLLVYDPFLLRDVGFQLTFLLTLAMLVAPVHFEHLLAKIVPAERLPKFAYAPLQKFLGAILLTILCQLISTPLILTINPRYTPLSLLANLYILPLIAVLLPAAAGSLLLGLLHPALAALPATLVSRGLHLMADPLTYAAQQGWLLRNLQAPTPLWLFLYYSGWLLFILRVPPWNFWRAYTVPAVACLLALGIFWRAFAAHDLRVTFLDVGQGDSILLEMPHQIWLVDGGGIPGFQHSDYDPGERVVVPALASKGIDDIDTLVLTHADEDHVRGLAAVLHSFRVHQLLVSDLTADAPFYQSLLQEARRQHIPIHQVRAGELYTPEPNLTIRIFNPPRTPYRNTRSDTNSNSVVFTLTYGARNFLFTGDLEGEVEPQLPPLPHVDVLKVAHHGSGHSSTVPFLEKTTPAHAVLSVGAHNRYGHPASSTLQRLQNSGAAIWRTDISGAIVCETDGQNLDIYSWSARGY
ncbi:hypothetical protein EL26_00920 [Tumebacillus flagellatus]|uniref:Metallo-beta-lactamase domain-containing protein n=1 Tax=Tumebacillus flagellatus TaxID=1157490 RepID=A0A074LXK1_9BACL|nr:hypothetical protein EL26_00920 [Tumebacillus flagellatus]